MHPCGSIQRRDDGKPSLTTRKVLTYRCKLIDGVAFVNNSMETVWGNLHIYFVILYFSSFSISVYACGRTHITHKLLTKSISTKSKMNKQ
jgi:hypothetical protein